MFNPTIKPDRASLHSRRRSIVAATPEFTRGPALFGLIILRAHFAVAPEFLGHKTTIAAHIRIIISQQTRTDCIRRKDPAAHGL